jgi:hypothetical protein
MAMVSNQRVSLSQPFRQSWGVSYRSHCRCSQTPLQQDKLLCTQASSLSGMARNAGYRFSADAVLQVK